MCADARLSAPRQETGAHETLALVSLDLDHPRSDEAQVGRQRRFAVDGHARDELARREYLERNLARPLRIPRTGPHPPEAVARQVVDADAS
ncbi:MAG: hypothetical protein ACYS0E_20605 [Planctomycetota bacterium]